MCASEQQSGIDCSNFTSSFQNLLASMESPAFSSQEFGLCSIENTPLFEQTNKSGQWMTDPFSILSSNTTNVIENRNANSENTLDKDQGNTLCTSQTNRIEVHSKPEEKGEVLIVRQGNSLATISSKKNIHYVDITKYLGTHSQREAAKALGIPSSTLSKRWREATVGRKWPQKIVQKIDKEIESIIRNGMRDEKGNISFTPEAERTIAELIKKKNHELRPAVIRM